MAGLHECLYCGYGFEDDDALQRHLTEGFGCPEQDTE